MNEKTVSLVSTLGAGLICLIFLSWWLLHNPVADFTESLPGRDNRPDSYVGEAVDADIGSMFASFEGIPSRIPGALPVGSRGAPRAG